MDSQICLCLLIIVLFGALNWGGVGAFDHDILDILCDFNIIAITGNHDIYYKHRTFTFFA